LRAGASGEITVPITVPPGTSVADYRLVAAAGSGGDFGVFAAQVNLTPLIGTLVSAGPLAKSLSSYRFTVSYHDQRRVDTTTLDGNDILVTGPGGFAARARFVSAASGKHASTQVVQYAIDGPRGGWDSADNGVYTFHLQSNQVSNTSGIAAPADRLGSFTVAIPAVQRSASASLQTATEIVHARRNISELLKV
jgi:hypothetical protein